RSLKALAPMTSAKSTPNPATNHASRTVMERCIALSIVYGKRSTVRPHPLRAGRLAVDSSAPECGIQDLTELPDEGRPAQSLTGVRDRTLLQPFRQLPIAKHLHDGLSERLRPGRRQQRIGLIEQCPVRRDVRRHDRLSDV